MPACRDEQQIIARMYAQALQKAGFDVTLKLNAGARTAYMPALRRGELDVVPDYLAPVTDYLRAGVPVARAAAGGERRRRAHRARAGPIARRPAARGHPAVAGDRPDRVRRDEVAADDDNLATVSDLARLNGTLVLGGPQGCSTDPYCAARPAGAVRAELQGGRRDRRGVRHSRCSTRCARARSTSAPVQSSAGGIAAESLVVLRDDKLLQPAGNIVALYREPVAGRGPGGGRQREPRAHHGEAAGAEQAPGPRRTGPGRAGQAVPAGRPADLSAARRGRARG